MPHNQKFFPYQKNLPQAIYNKYKWKRGGIWLQKRSRDTIGYHGFVACFRCFLLASRAPYFNTLVLSIQVPTPQSSEFRAVSKQFIGMNFQTAKVTTGYYTVLSVKGGRTSRELRTEDYCKEATNGNRCQAEEEPSTFEQIAMKLVVGAGPDPFFMFV